MEIEREIPITYKNYGLYVGNVFIATIAENKAFFIEGVENDILTDFFYDCDFFECVDGTVWNVELFLDTDDEKFYADSEIDGRGDEYSCRSIESFSIYLEKIDITGQLPSDILQDIGIRLEEKEAENYTPRYIGTLRTIP